VQATAEWVVSSPRDVKPPFVGLPYLPISADGIPKKYYPILKRMARELS